MTTDSQEESTSKTIKNFAYGLLAPTSGAEILDAEMRAGHDYYNALIALERERRDAYRALMNRHPDIQRINDEIAPLVEDLDRLYEALAQQSAAARRKVPPSDEQKTRVAELKATLKTLRAQLKNAKAALKADTDIALALAEQNAAHAAKSKAAYNAATCYWGSRLAVGNAVEAAVENSRLDPRFKRYDGTGRVSVQCQGGLDTSKIHDVANTLVRIGSVDHDRAFSKRGAPTAPGEGRRAAQRTILYLRVASTEKGRPVWAEFPMVLHRPLPPGRIKWVHVHRDRVADRATWTVTITIDIAPAAPSSTRPTPPLDSTIALDIGWRLMPSGDLRVAYGHANDGSTREFLLPKSLLDAEQRLRDVESIRARALDAAKTAIAEWRTGEGKEVELVDSKGAPLDLAALHLWRNPGRVVSLLRHNSDKLPAPLVASLTTYAVKDLRAWRVNECRRKRTRRRRDGLQRLWAAELSRDFHTIVLERMKLTKFVDKDVSILNRHRGFANHGAWLAMLKESPARIVEVDPAYTSLTCADCRHVNSSWTTTNLEQTCEGCRVTWDIDANAARILLARAQTTHVEPDEALEPAATASRSQKSARMLRFDAAKQRVHQPDSEALANTTK